MCREEAHYAEWSYSSMLRGLRETPIPREGPSAAERRPCDAQRRSLCREEALCAGKSIVLRGLEEAPVSGGSPVPRGGPLCSQVLSSVLKGLKEAPVSGGGSLCRIVLLLYAEGIEGGPYIEKRPLCH